MNCVNHPDTPVSAYCQNCGKALCANCVRSVAGMIYCEQCLAARLGISGTAAGAAAGASGVPGSIPGVVATAGPNPGTAFALGFIPGVGAMYNGQFVKGLVHVLIFVILVGITKHEDIFGIFVAAWVAYQVFDAYQTAKAKRLGLPLPDPFGLNELGGKMGIPGPIGGPGSFGGPGGIGGPAVPPPPVPGVGVPPPGAGFVDPYGTHSGTYQGTYPGVPPVPPPGVGPYAPPPPFDPSIPPPRRQPIGAFILIGLGVLFLLNTLDVFHFDWFGRLWPLLIIAFGALLFVRRTREAGPPPPPPPPPSSTGGQQ
jgi:TM2 domain-containing membrane protein YozV